MASQPELSPLHQEGFPADPVNLDCSVPSEPQGLSVYKKDHIKHQKLWHSLCKLVKNAQVFTNICFATTWLVKTPV